MTTSPALSTAPGYSGRSVRLPWRSALAGSLIMAIAAHVAVPFWPVPLTLQSLAVLALGAALGPVAAMSAVLAWIVEGVAGLPVFAGGTGAATLLGPTGGYIVGYLVAAPIAGLVARNGRFGSIWSAACVFLMADAALFAAGVGWLAVLVGWRHAIAGGLTPFLLGEALKISLVTVGVALLSRRP